MDKDCCLLHDVIMLTELILNLAKLLILLCIQNCVVIPISLWYSIC